MAEPSVAPRILIAQVNLADELDSALPLEHTAVHAQVIGPLATVVVTQRFGNPLKEAAEMDYLFPLPAEAVVTGFEIQIGARRVQGDLQEAKTARKSYQTARDAGQRSGLLEQRRPNLVAVRLANVQPGETILATMRYQERLKFDDDSYEFIFPMGITPRYDSPQHPSESQGVHAPLAKADEKIGLVDIQVAVDAGVSLVREPVSPSHPLVLARIDERRFQVRLSAETIPDHDFVLRYAVAGQQAAAAAWVSAEPDEDMFLACLLPPRLEEDSQPAPREFIFVLDRSGSMSGEPIAQARNALRACLRTLNPQDSFRILLFDNELEWYRPEPVAVTQAGLDEADRYLAGVSGRGGTEIIRAIEAALSAAGDASRTRYVVFLTDGAVSAEERALERVRAMMAGARLFTFGIGPSVNRALLSRMAGLGRGRAEFLQLDEDIEGAIIRFQDSVSFPLVTDLQLTWENAKAWDLYPPQLPDLYAGQAVALSGRLTRQSNGPARLILKGQRGGQPVEVVVTLPAASGHEPAIGRLWAQARLFDLLEQMAVTPDKADRLRAEIVGLALAHNLASPYTSFVAIDQEQTAAGEQLKVIHVAVPLPKGLSIEPFRHGLPKLAAMLPSTPAMPGPASAGFGTTVASLARNILSRTGGSTPVSHAKMARGSGHSISESSSMAEESLTSFTERESGLRWLARTQNLDGSWQNDVECTAAALLAFLRAGHTPRSGSFRALMRRGVQWISATRPSGLGAFLRAQVLAELAERSGDDKDRSAAQSARVGLPAPVDRLEAASSGAAVPVPQSIQSLDDLRLAGILKAGPRSLPPGLLSGSQAALAQIWAVSLL